ncbi:hypothetical protein ACVIHI_008413 [Bradyrhizobium sp. USDA 4524]|nr:hypothetical protein [Bradyrhizobium sp. USDA 4538]MCP1899226.1 hypothetical protein [Bradyrhizobium sp. USDA 4537]MCP1986662.1 hypothetical protein [Bradyrhizobium sp. USDA 4539]
MIVNFRALTTITSESTPRVAIVNPDQPFSGGAIFMLATN